MSLTLEPNSISRSLSRLCWWFIVLIVPVDTAASTITIFAEDQAAGYNSSQLTRAAEDLFLSLSSAFVTDDFESHVRGDTHFAYDFGGTMTVFDVSPSPSGSNIAPSGIAASFFDGGLNGLQILANVTIEFSQVISGFGFYGIDWGDAGGQMRMTAVRPNGETINAVVPATLGSSSGSVFYFGLVDFEDGFTSVRFEKIGRVQDVMTFEDFSITALPVSEPSIALLLMLSVALLAGSAGRRRTSARCRFREASARGHQRPPQIHSCMRGNPE